MVALAFVLWRLSFDALGLLLSLVQLPSAASAHGLCCVLRFRSSSSSSFFSSSSSSFSLPFSFSSSSWLSSSLAVCVLCDFLPASLAWHCLVSGLPLCLIWSDPPDFFLLLLLFCPQLCGVGGDGGLYGGAGDGGGGGHLLAFGVWPAFVHWRGGGWRLFAFGFWCGWLVVAFARLWYEASICSLAWWMVSVCLPLVLVWLAGGRRFSRLWCEASVCSLTWWWLAFVRLWFWYGWLVVAFARLWWPRVCSLGSGWGDAVPGSCWCFRPSSF